MRPDVLASLDKKWLLFLPLSLTQQGSKPSGGPSKKGPGSGVRSPQDLSYVRRIYP